MKKRIQFLLYCVITALALTAGSFAYKRQVPIDYCRGGSNDSAEDGISICEAYSLEQIKPDNTQYRGWPYSFLANAPKTNSGDPEVDAIRLDDYKNERRVKIQANFVVYFIASAAGYSALLLIKKARRAHTRN